MIKNTENYEQIPIPTNDSVYTISESSITHDINIHIRVISSVILVWYIIMKW